MKKSFLNQLQNDKKKKQIAVLLDPDSSPKELESSVKKYKEAGVNYFFIGGSLIVNPRLDAFLQKLREMTDIPTVLFPGSSYQMSYYADAILFLSLISGRNAELLIGQHVIAAPYLKISPLEIVPTGYILIDGGVPTSVSYMSNTNPIPHNKPDIALCTAMAGEMLGLKALFLDAGSGAKIPISAEIIETVRDGVDIPLIVGGGIRGGEIALQLVAAGADLLVVGNALEKNPDLIFELCEAVHQYV